MNRKKSPIPNGWGVDSEGKVDSKFSSFYVLFALLL